MSTETSASLTVVVGVDGSPNSIAALDWAARYLDEHNGGTLQAIMTWTYPTVAVASMGLGGAIPPANAMIDATTEALAEIIAGVEFPESVTVTQSVSEGVPAAAIIEAGASANLIVIGKRGHGGFLGLVLGSVATHVINHAPCPVVVVPYSD